MSRPSLKCVKLAWAGRRCATDAACDSKSKPNMQDRRSSSKPHAWAARQGRSAPARWRGRKATCSGGGGCRRSYIGAFRVFGMRNSTCLSLAKGMAAHVQHYVVQLRLSTTTEMGRECLGQHVSRAAAIAVGFQATGIAYGIQMLLAYVFIHQEACLQWGQGRVNVHESTACHVAEFARQSHQTRTMARDMCFRRSFSHWRCLPEGGSVDSVRPGLQSLRQVVNSSNWPSSTLLRQETADQSH